jgi:hypothetical protein
MGLTVLHPTLSARGETAQMARGLDSLEGRTVGLLDNGKLNVARIFDHVEELLRSRHGVRAFVRRRKPDISRPAPVEMMAELRECDAVIAAVGD